MAIEVIAKRRMLGGLSLLEDGIIAVRYRDSGESLSQFAKNDATLTSNTVSGRC